MSRSRVDLLKLCEVLAYAAKQKDKEKRLIHVHKRLTYGYLVSVCARFVYLLTNERMQ